MDIFETSIKPGDSVIMTRDDTSHGLPIKSIQTIYDVDYSMFQGVPVLSVIDSHGFQKFFMADACEPVGTLLA